MALLRRFSIFLALCFTLLAQCCSLNVNYPVDDSCSSIFSDLAAVLSPDAAIVSPNQSDHQRWQAYASPTYFIVVEVAVEEDVQETVRFANLHSFPFLAIDGAHGCVASLANMQGGIAISFIRMKGIDIDDSGDFAELQPGLTNGDLIRGLWEQGKQTSTGICLCAGIMGIMLGGGHGYMQGRYGLVTDQILEARVVLADGNWVTASPQENTDLFWGLRGAGHNFGIVTGIKFKVYERLDEWSEIQMIFLEDKLEAVFQLCNDYIEEANHPPELTIWHIFVRMDDLSDNAVILMSLIYRGRLNDLEPYAAPFRAIGPLVEQQYDGVAYTDLFEINVLTEPSTTCDKGLYRNLAPTYLSQYNATSLRKVYSIFDGITAKYPEMGTHSTFMIEGYPIQGVTSVLPENTAVPFRDFALLLSPQLGYTNAAHINDILAANRDMRRAVVEGSGSERLYAYVNYALGDETLSEVYGHEPWRLQKLRELKRKYDPRGRFNFYMPIN